MAVTSSAVTSSVSSKRDGRRGGGWFPSWFLWPLFFLTSAFRVYYVLQPNNWWIMHPDEVYQALEVAHSEMYGYGFRAYEYNPPIEVHPDSIMEVPHVRKLEQKHGMAALRSYLLPHLYVMVTWVLELMGLYFTPFLTWKVAHTVAASTLPLAVYRYVRVVFRSHDTACLAAILCVSSAHLHILGTHTLVNSLLSAPVFWALSHLYTLVNPSVNPPVSQGGTDGNISQHDSKASTKDQISQPASPVKHQSSTPKNKGKQKHQKTGQKQRTTPLGNVITNRSTQNKNGTTHDSRSETTENLDINRNKSSVTGYNNGAVRTFPTTCSAQNGFAAEHSVSCHSSFKRKCVVFVQNLGAGLVIGACVYIRVDIAALVVLTLLPHWSPFRTRYADVTVCVFGSVCGLAVGVMDDFRCYGWGVLTPYNWYRFNVERDYSSILFGRHDLNHYILEIFFDNIGITVLSAVCCVCAVLLVFYPPWSRSSEKDVGLNPSWRSVTVRTCASWLFLLVLYSSKGHKEMRFVHNVIVLILITWAVLIQSSLLRQFSSTVMQKRVLAVVVILFALSQWREVAQLIDNTERGGNKMAFKQAGDTQDVNKCLYYISSRNDVTGVFLDRNLYATGGYTLLHKDVPVFTIFASNFLEFRKEDRMVERAKNIFGPRRNISVAYIGQFSNYLTTYHSQYVFKFLLEDPRYNYFVAMAKRDFAYFGLGEPVFQGGSFKVYRRPDNPSPDQRQRMLHARNIPPSSNATLLLHEADMLVYYGAYREACARFRLVLKAEPTQVGAYLPLASSHFRLGEEDESIKVMDECYDKFDRAKCEETRPALINQFKIYS